MVITYHGLQFFKLQYGDTVIAFDPPSKDSQYKSARFGADIVMSTTRHEDFLGGDLLQGGDKNPFIISGPGEYEVQGIFIKGFQAQTSYGGKETLSTIYYLTFEDMNILFLGALDAKELDSKAYEAIEDVDVLFIPIGEEGTLSPVEAHKLAVKLEASVIIPMNYDEKSLEVFLKEEGSEKKKPTEKLTLKPKEVRIMEGEIVVMEPTS